jgi:glycosyltransferase involved in cell wall biosynthesis
MFVKNWDYPWTKKLVVYTGHLYKWKGTDVLAQSANNLPEDCQVYFVGGTANDAKKFKNKYKDLIQNKRIVLVEHQPHSEMAKWQSAADVLVLPNSADEKISKNYTSPLKLFEYMASGRPVVASDLPSVREILNEDNCVFAEPDNPKDLAQKINLLLSDNKLAKTISAKAREDVLKFSWDKRALKIINLIKNER